MRSGTISGLQRPCYARCLAKGERRLVANQTQLIQIIHKNRAQGTTWTTSTQILSKISATQRIKERLGTACDVTPSLGWKFIAVSSCNRASLLELGADDNKRIVNERKLKSTATLGSHNARFAPKTQMVPTDITCSEPFFQTPAPTQNSGRKSLMFHLHVVVFPAALVTPLVEDRHNNRTTKVMQPAPSPHTDRLTLAPYTFQYSKMKCLKSSSITWHANAEDHTWAQTKRPLTKLSRRGAPP